MPVAVDLRVVDGLFAARSPEAEVANVSNGHWQVKISVQSRNLLHARGHFIMVCYTFHVLLTFLIRYVSRSYSPLQYVPRAVKVCQFNYIR